MAENKLKELLKKVESDLEARKKVEDLEKPADEKGAIAYYQEMAKRLGVTLTEDDIREAFAERMKAQKSKTDAAAEKVEAMADDALAKVGGGLAPVDIIPDKCQDTYESGENCWVTDGCDKIFMTYRNYSCRSSYNGHTCSYKDTFICDSAMF